MDEAANLKRQLPIMTAEPATVPALAMEVDQDEIIRVPPLPRVAAFAAVGLPFTWPNPCIARVRPISAAIGVACQELSLAGQG